MRRPRALAAVFGGIVAFGLLAGALAQELPGVPIATGLNTPFKVHSEGETLLVAEAGGRLISISPTGEIDVIARGLPTQFGEGPEGPTTTGPTAVIAAAGGFFFTVGEALDPAAGAGFASLYFVAPPAEPVLIADLHAFEVANNVDDGVAPDGSPDLNSNPFDLALDPAGGAVLVADAGANAILRVTFEGEITPFAIFPARENPLFGSASGAGMPEGGPTFQQVPTSVDVAPDGSLLVSTLTGFPFPVGEARVLRLRDLNNDNDALDEGEVTVEAVGLTAATDVAVDADGSLLVTEFSTNMLTQAPGRLVRVPVGAAEGELTVVAPVLISPTGVTVTPSGRIVVTQTFAGAVSQVSPLPVEPDAGPGGPAAPTPPETGNAGSVAAGSSQALGAAGVLAVVLAGLTLGGRIATRRG